MSHSVQPSITCTIQLTVPQKKKNNVSVVGSFTQPCLTPLTWSNTPGQQTGTEFQRTKEQQAAIMRQKQEEGNASRCVVYFQISSMRIELPHGSRGLRGPRKRVWKSRR